MEGEKKNSDKGDKQIVTYREEGKETQIWQK